VKRRTIIRNANQWGVPPRAEGGGGREGAETRKGRREQKTHSARPRCLLPVRRVFAYPRHDQDPICIAPMKLLPSCAVCESSSSSHRTRVGGVCGCTPGVVRVVNSLPGLDVLGEFLGAENIPEYRKIE